MQVVTAFPSRKVSTSTLASPGCSGPHSSDVRLRSTRPGAWASSAFTMTAATEEPAALLPLLGHAQTVILMERSRDRRSFLP